MKRTLLQSILLGAMMLLAAPAFAQEWTLLPSEYWYRESGSDLSLASPDGEGTYKVSVRGGTGLDAWDSSFFVTFGKENALNIGDVMSVTFKVKADAPATFKTQSHRAPNDYVYWGCIGDVSATTSWKEIVREVTVDENMEGMYTICFNLTDGQENNAYFKDFEVKVKREKEIDSWTDIIVNGDMEGESSECFYVTEQSIGGPYLANITEGIGKDGSRAVMVKSSDNAAQDWDTQFFVRMPYQLLPEGKFRISFDYKADKVGDFDTQSDTEPGCYIHYACVGSGTFTTEWRRTITPDMRKEGQLFQTIAFNLAKNKVATQFIFDNVKFEIPSDDITTLTKNPAVNPQPYPLIEIAMALAADDEAVAVGKLRDAIDWANSYNDTSQLQAAIDQFKADNADQEKDETAKVATNGWKDFNGNPAGICQTQYAPAIITYDGRTAQLAEVYEGSTNGVNRTGTIIYQDISGLTNGKYKVGFYGNAFFTSGRGFDSPMFNGAEDVAYVFANDEQAFITSRVATATTANDFRQFDVEVTNGNIRLGMGKAKAGTNWHTMQIYQLTWFTTAKEAYAAYQAELEELLQEATILDADANKTNGRPEFEVAYGEASGALYSNWYNIPEIEAIIANLRVAIDNFKKANYFIDFAAGEYYIIDAESGLMMAAGHDWGTQGIVNELGLDLTLTPNETTRGVTIDSRVSNGGNQHFLGSNLYMDSNESEWFLDYQGFGFYILNSEGRYINIDDNNNLALSDTPREWIIVSAAGVRDQILEEMAEATRDNPVDATFLIKASNFNRNDARNAEAWSISEDCTNSNLSGGNSVNNCAESYHSTFIISQTIPDAPVGIYQLTAQGFYREDDADEHSAPFFFMGNPYYRHAQTSLPAIAGSENNMADASESFTAGQYTIEPFEFFYDGKGGLTVGIRGTAHQQWVIFDNFKLTYLGCPQVVYTEFDEEVQTLTYYYDNQIGKRSGETRIFDPDNDPIDHRFAGSPDKIQKAVIDPSMKEAPLTSTSGMFHGLYVMDSIEGLENLNTANVTDMSDMFLSCQTLKWLDLSTFNTSNVQNMTAMFYNCPSLSSLDISSFDTSNATEMNSLFYNCRSLTSLDLRSFDISKAEKMRAMFAGCENLNTIYCDEDWSHTTAVTEFMFENCSALEGSKGTKYSDYGVMDATYARPDGGTNAPGYFTSMKEVYTEFVEETGTLTYYYDDQRASRSGNTESYDPFNTYNDNVRFAGYHKKVTTVAIDPSMKSAPITSLRNLTYGGMDFETFTIYVLPNVTSFEGLENLNTAIVTDMNSMFSMCSSLTSLDLSTFNTSNVTNMNGMFLGCNKLQELDLTSFDVSNVTDMQMMFGSCFELKTIYCEEDWSQVVPADNMYVMFSGCNKLVGSRGTKFDNNYTNGTYARPDGGTKAPGYFTKKEVYTEFAEETGTLTFYYDNQMASREGVIDIYDPADLDAPRFDGYSDNVLKAVIDPSMQEAPLTSFESMFCGSWNDETHRYNNLSQMKTVEGLGNLNTDGVMSTRGMFANCEALTSLDFSSFTAPYLQRMDQMFINCHSLTSLDLSTFNTEHVMNLDALFFQCYSLQIVDITSFNIDNVYSMASMFSHCSKLTTICCYGDWSTSTANSDYMFQDCTALIGGLGTRYDSSFTDATYARSDGGPSAPGYFTAETITSVKAIDKGQTDNEGAVYNLAGQRLNKTQKGINIVGGKKVMK